MYENRTVCLILPAWNEEALIGETLAAIPAIVDRVIVVDDGSRDRTAEIAREHGAEVVSHGRNRGVGAAFNTGLRAALARDVDIVVNMDADGQFDPADIEALLRPMIEQGVDFVTASRFKDERLYPRMSKTKFAGNRLMSALISRMTGRRFFDVSCGFRAYSRDALARLNLFGEFTYTQETFLDFAFKNVSILEVPVEVRGVRKEGTSRVASNLFRYAYQTMKIIVRTVRDYRPFKLFAGLAAVAFLPGVALAVFLAVHYARSGGFSPHKWAGFTAGFLLMIAALCFFLGFVLDMFARMRLNQEEILYQLKKRR
ncbi:MAG TPA: glycosyltransferase family 2 protein [Alphaproteobacteria bacterium]|nr:glycosyltransferase family 2 protein [Alphaproteobacteria bacterium]